ncbi:MAG TPA: hypothetical protein VFZ61_31535, partial [Polyangiales bacterium]
PSVGMPAASLRFDPKLLLDHVSARGPRVTDVRGSLVLQSLKLLRDAGHYDAYAEALPPEHRETLQQALAASWVSTAALVSHFRVVDSLVPSDAQLARLGELLGKQIMDSLFASLIRTARSAGAEAGIWLALKQVDRIWNRMYQGGGVAVLQTGPKDAIFEVHGMPVATSRYFRLSHGAFVRASVLMVARVCVVKEVPARRPSPESLAISISWV